MFYAVFRDSVYLSSANNEQPLSKKQRREFVEFPPEDEVEPPLQFVEQPDEFQVANYNLQPLQTIKINVQVPGKLH